MLYKLVSNHNNCLLLGQPQMPWDQSLQYISKFRCSKGGKKINSTVYQSGSSKMDCNYGGFTAKSAAQTLRFIIEYQNDTL